MSLKILQPNLTPAGQFDLNDDYSDIIIGGECAMFETLVDNGTDAYASDSVVVGPQVSVVFGKPGPKTSRDSSNNGASRTVFLADEGIEEYGTIYGTVIGGTSGQGTGMGNLNNSGVITVGPKTSFGSGKCTLFSAMGIYGLPLEVINTTGLVANDLLVATGGHSSPTASTGDGHWLKGNEPTSSGHQINYAATAIGFVNDSSLVSTTFTHASGVSGDAEYYAIYFCGVESVTKH
jgi:hypothetical protein